MNVGVKCIQWNDNGLKQLQTSLKLSKIMMKLGINAEFNASSRLLEAPVETLFSLFYLMCCFTMINKFAMYLCRYLVLANMLMQSEVNPFDAQEAKP
jgi:hypothetical protein